MEKLPADSEPGGKGGLKASRVFPRSGEWKTRAALPPVANHMLESGTEAPLTRRSSTRAMQRLLAAKAPSPSSDSGSCEDWTACQDSPSSVASSSNSSFPFSSGMGSPTTMPCLGSQKAMESKNPLGFELVNCNCQCWPASDVW